jgi:hypothetical protein
MIAGPKNRQLDKKYACATGCASYALSFAQIISVRRRQVSTLTLPVMSFYG